ncbi:hypothetical protein K458DRAFT_382660 [Lentithecium fluviatile CBS 122367]|uniref:Dolichyl-diphosphooligosaccharide--protein glycosyltransferase subunit 4 n=1 Tax=Lentithecium fluviatile CBS 122367 TaxID=1168545 RepID=A0A6G1JKJ4_9PLEO|nr:hypothetical protein K458DRAFT_382660 [Lentithecium fluviatile CBS 122367]
MTGPDELLSLPGILQKLRIHQTLSQSTAKRAANMISDSQLYSLAIFLGSAAMLLIVLYHFLEVNSEEHLAAEKPKTAAGKVKS